ncbi:MAG TPA: FtsW/RodA/SpoVE family cell cycle protein [Candidatus Fimousia stercorigallinarum]|nr:FtsW/RodA/SpoVE family cell cycle protein [Candidatus Fimousia stercorigallinarum]
MVSLITIVSKYLILILCFVYTLSSFTVFLGNKSHQRVNEILDNQVWYLFTFHFVCYFVLFIQTWNLNVLFFFAAQIIFFELIMLLYPRIYKRCSRKMLNNMCFLLGIGFIILTRLSFDLAVKQFMIVAASFLITALIPLCIEKMTFLNKLGWVYAIGGLLILVFVLFFGTSKNGSTNWIKITESFYFQPSEIVKIVFVFFVASMLSKAKEFKDLVKITVIAALYVVVLVVERDLGAALLFFMIYMMMLYAATAKMTYLLAGFGAGSVASVLAYFIFNHVRERVMAWQDPFSIIEGKGYQICQSLFAIGTGGWFGLGLNQGRPTDVPVYESDFIFSGICEEFGVLFGLCVILICSSMFLSIMQISTRIQGLFYKLLCLGFGVCYFFQVFLNIGGVTKFIPSTGVTLPLVSYGGTSVACTMLMFGIIQGLYMISNRKEVKDDGILEEKEETADDKG